jgi:uncharacterized protein (DUF486 family)
MNTLIQTRWFHIALLSCSNVFMTFADLLSAGVERSFIAARLKQ